MGANHASVPPRVDSPVGIDPPGAGELGDLDRWTALHEAAERLPVEEREVFGLTFYHGWTQQQIGELFGVDERTVRRRLRRAVEELTAELGGELPGE